MAGGLVALLDDVAALAKLAAASVDDIAAASSKASAKAAGVVVDDIAVTPQYVQGVAAKRELSIIKKIAIGSLRNKMLFILPAAVLMNEFIPWLLTPLLMFGGLYLSFEGAEKVWEKLRGHQKANVPVAAIGPDQESTMVSSAIRTDFILSAEIMVISLNEVADEGFWSLAAILAVVGIAVTLLIYGVVAIIVKIDDVGLSLMQRSSSVVQRIGHGMVRGMPHLLAVISVVGTAAMLWVGGHILLVGVDDLGWHGPYDAVHHAAEAAGDALGGLGAMAEWLTNTLAAGLIGLAVGGLLVAVLHAVPGRKGSHA